MKFLFRHFAVSLFFILALSVVIPPICAEDRTPTLVINDEVITIAEDMGYIMMRNDRVVVPLRLVLNHLGFEVYFNEEDETAIAVNGSDIFIVQINSNVLFVNNQMIEMDVPTFTVNDRTHLPISFLARALGYTVTWDDDTWVASLTKQ